MATINFRPLIDAGLTEDSGTTTITGDNGVSTTMSYIVRGDWTESNYGGDNGNDLQFSGTNSTDFLEPLYDLTFDEPVTNFTFTMYDFDSGGSWDDQIRIVAIGPQGEPVVITQTNDGQTVDVERDGTEGVLQLEMQSNGDDDQVYISIAGPLSNVQIFYENGESETNDTGIVDIGSFEFEDVLDDYVDGTANADTIDGSYMDDPEGEQVDNGDSTGANTSNERSDDDYIRGFGGDDTINGGQGADNVDGGSGNDTITDTGTATAASTEPGTLQWSAFGAASGGTLDHNTALTIGANTVTFTITGQQDDSTTAASSVIYNTDEINVTDFDDGSNVIADNDSSLEFDADNGGDTHIRLTFEKEVQDVEFNISDIEDLSEFIIRAYDIDGNLVQVDLYNNTGDTDISISSGTEATAEETNDEDQLQTDADGTITVKIAGPIVRLDITHDVEDDEDVDPNISDINFVTICDEVSANDTIDGGSGDDVISAGDGDDLVCDTGTDETSTVREVLNWASVDDPDSGNPIDDNDPLEGGFTYNTTNNTVTYTHQIDIGTAMDTEFADDTLGALTGVDQGGLGFDSDSSQQFDSHNDDEESEYRIDFANDVENVQFRIFGLEEDSTIVITAFDSSGNEVAVNFSDVGSGIDSATDANPGGGINSATIVSDNGGNAPSSADGAATVTIAGPISYYVVNYFHDHNDDAHVHISDVYFDTIIENSSDDNIDGEAGNDTLKGGQGEDTVCGGEGDDVIFGGGAAEKFKVEYFDFTTSLSTLADAGFDSTGENSNTPDATFYANDLDVATFDADNGGDGEEYAVRVESTLIIETGGTYDFTTTSDDGSILWIDGVEVVNNDGLHGSATESGSITLGPGEYTVVIGFFENGGSDSLSATIDGPDVSGGPIALETHDNLYAFDDSSDTLKGEADDDLIYGGGGADDIDGGTGTDTMYGGSGDDDIIINEGDVADGGTGDDDFTIDAAYDDTDNFNATVSGGADGTGTGQTAQPDDFANEDDGDTLDLSNSDNGVTVTYGAGAPADGTPAHEDGTVTGIDTLDDGADITFDEIENIIYTGNDDVADASGSNVLGEDITINTGGGDDTIIGGGGVTADGGDGDDVFEIQDSTGTITIVGGETGETDGDCLDFTDWNLTEAQADTLRTYIQGVIDTQSPDEGTGDYSGSITIDGLTVTFSEIEKFVVCFTRGTQILTDRGEVAIEDLEEGDCVQTMDSGLQPIRWIGSSKRKARGNLAPICIKEGTLGNARDLFVSPQHRMLITGWRAELLTGETEVLASAKSLVNDSTITRVEGGEVEYFHMLFDKHEIVFAEGAPSESFHPGQEGWKALDAPTRDEILELFPELEDGAFENYGPTARTNVKFGDGQVLSQYLSKN